jgi:hypothetical protein
MKQFEFSNLKISKFRKSLIDAYLFAYLSILYKAPFVGSQLKSHLLICSNLCSLISRTKNDIFTVDVNGFILF